MRLLLPKLTQPFPLLSKQSVMLGGAVLLILVMSGIMGNPFELLSIAFLTVLFPISIWLGKLGRLGLERLPEQIRISTIGVGTAMLISFFLWSVSTLIHLKYFALKDVLALDPAAIILLVALVVSVHGLHMLLYHIYRATISGQANNVRFLFYLLGLLTMLVVTRFEVQISFVHVVAYVVYCLLLDLFIEAKRVNLIWLIVWTIVLGSFLTMSIVSGTNSYIVRHVPLLNAFTLFSLTFVLSGFLYIIYGLINRKNILLPTEWAFSFSSSLNLRSRIQLSTMMTLVFSFITIGYISVYFYNVEFGAGAASDLSSNFIQGLLNTYVFLFLLGFSISFSLSQYIRDPLVQLGSVLKDVKLQGENKKLKWSGSDEIGTLIKEYNAMIEKLQVNADMLATVERDNAWREMSKQVAHEIKNPLTPMKLSLQHLQMTIASGRDDVQEMTKKMCSTLMNQIDNLQQIADEFSNFGSLPQSVNKRISLNEVVEQIHELFRNREDMDVQLIAPMDDISVYADKNQLVRVLNNIVKNSIQAIPEDRIGRIIMRLWREESKALITVRDNGSGISDEQKKKIFQPRFTTKSSGSGLGLAIAANMVDSMGGTIRFESRENVGTIFFIELPLIRNVVSKKEHSEDAVVVDL